MSDENVKQEVFVVVDERPSNGVTATPILKATPASEWGAESDDGVYYTLPGSGKVAKLRRPGMMGMASEAGFIPNPLSDDILRFLADHDNDALRTMTPQQRMEVFKKNTEAFIDMARLCFVEPKVAPKGRKADRSRGEINPRDILDWDYNWLVYSFVEGSLERVAPFRLDGSTS